MKKLSFQMTLEVSADLSAEQIENLRSIVKMLHSDMAELITEDLKMWHSVHNLPADAVKNLLISDKEC